MKITAHEQAKLGIKLKPKRKKAAPKPKSYKAKCCGMTSKHKDSVLRHEKNESCKNIGKPGNGSGMVMGDNYHLVKAVT